MLFLSPVGPYRSILHRSLLYPITIQYCKYGVRSDPTNGALMVGAAESRRAVNCAACIIGSAEERVIFAPGVGMRPSPGQFGRND